MKKAFLFLFVLGLALILRVPETKAQTPVITPGTANITSDNRGVIYWTTDINATCGIDFSQNSDLSGGTGTNGNLIQVGLPTNDGKFHFYVQLMSLTPNTDYHYRITCAVGDGQSVMSETKLLPKFAPPLAITVGTGSVTVENKGIIYWATNISADCEVLYSRNVDLTGRISASGRIIQAGSPTNDGKFYFTAEIPGLIANTDYYYHLNCSAGDGRGATSDIKILPKYIQPDQGAQTLTIIQGFGSITTENKGIIYWATNVSADCHVDYSQRSDLNGGSSVTGWTIQTGTPTNDGKFYFAAEAPGLAANTDYYFLIVCAAGGGQSVRSEIKFLPKNTAAVIAPPSSSGGAAVVNPTISAPIAEPIAIVPETIPTINVSTTSQIALEKNENGGMVLKLQRQISELERKVIDLEEKLTKLDEKFAAKYAGTMFLDVANQGRLWYVDPDSKNRFYFENGASALSIGSRLALGISFDNLKKIPIGVPEKLYGLTDTDGDGLPDRLEAAIGSDPNKIDTDGDGYKDGQEINNGYTPDNSGKYAFDGGLAKRMEGKMLLQVDGANSHGEIWYVKDGKRWYGGTQDSMYEIMKAKSLGATSDNIRKIAVGDVAN